MSINELSSKGQELVSQLLDPDYLGEIVIKRLKAAEDALQKIAYETGYDPVTGYDLYDTAYELRLFRLKLNNILNTMNDDRGREKDTQE